MRKKVGKAAAGYALGLRAALKIVEAERAYWEKEAADDREFAAFYRRGREACDRIATQLKAELEK